MAQLILVFHTLLSTLRDVLPIVAVIFVFQLGVLRQPIPNPKRMLIGFGYVIVGLALFLIGLEEALFPLGRLMAQQLTAPSFVYGAAMPTTMVASWHHYFWVYLFAAAIGFSTTVAEPALLAVAGATTVVLRAASLTRPPRPRTGLAGRLWHAAHHQRGDRARGRERGAPGAGRHLEQPRLPG